MASQSTTKDPSSRKQLKRNISFKKNKSYMQRLALSPYSASNKSNIKKCKTPAKKRDYSPFSGRKKMQTPKNDGEIVSKISRKGQLSIQSLDEMASMLKKSLPSAKRNRNNLIPNRSNSHPGYIVESLESMGKDGKVVNFKLNTDNVKRRNSVGKQ
jgi:hypothetical protein